MLFSTMGQGAIFLWMAGAGVLIGLWYALCRGLCRVLFGGALLSLLCDLLFGAGAAGLLLGALVLGNYGRVRLFELLGAGLGFLLTACGISPVLGTLARGLGRGLYGLWRKLAGNHLIKVIFK